MGCHIAKGVSERYIARLLLTIIQTPDNVNYRHTEQHIKAYNPNHELAEMEKKNVQSGLPSLPTLQESRPRRNVKQPTRLDM